MMMARIHAFIIGILINIQFFTTIPLKKQFQMDRIHMKYTLRTFPILGLLQGGVYAGTVFLLSSYTPLSHLMITLCLWLVLLIISGGIHLDGLIDTSDAYFSYQNSDERLKIMQDPRVGAFGVLAIIVFLITRFLILYELVTMLHEASYLFIVLIPFFGKMYMEMCLQHLPPAREGGIAVFFQQGTSNNFRFVHGIYIVLIGLIIAIFNTEFLSVYFILILVMILTGYLFTGKIMKNFRGITGDLLGASTEGMELLLWIVVLLLHYYAMV